jgi:hypothetical protein
MSDSGRASTPVAACGILVAFGAPNSYIFIYSLRPNMCWVESFPLRCALMIYPSGCAIRSLSAGQNAELVPQSEGLQMECGAGFENRGCDGRQRVNMHGAPDGTSD